MTCISNSGSKMRWILLALLLFGRISSAAIAYVGGNDKNFTAASSFSLTFTSSANATDILIVGAGVGGTDTVSAVSWAGVSFTRVTEVAGNNVDVLGNAVWYFMNPSPNTTSNVTVTVSGGAVSSAIAIMEYSGQAQSSTFPTIVYGKVGGVGSIISTTITTSVANSLVLNNLIDFSSAPSNSTSFTLRRSALGLVVEIGADKLASTPGSVNSYWTSMSTLGSQFLIEMAPSVPTATATRAIKITNNLKLQLR